MEIDQSVFFKRKLGAIKRSTGGLGLAEALQIVVTEPTDNRTSHIRIRVRVKDFRRNAAGLAVGANYQFYTKIVHPEELKEPFSLDQPGAPRLVIDFGQGLVPVDVFHYERRPDGSIQAKFVEGSDLEALSRAPKNENFEINTYSIDRDIIRLANDREHAIAQARRAGIKRAYGRVVPEELRQGAPLRIPTRLSRESMRNCLRLATQPEEKSPPKTGIISLQWEDTIGLMPFGILEG